MIPSDCGRLITACSYFDNRKNSEEAMIAWSRAISEDVSVRDALDAIAAHYAATSDWIGPSHINAGVRVIQRARVKAAIDASPGGVIPMPGDLDQADERRWRRAWIAAAQVCDPDPVGVANRAVGIRRAELEAVPMPDEVRRQIAGFVKAHAVPPVGRS